MSNLEKNTVSAQAQVQKNVEIVQRGGTYKVLFVGNSITRHAPKPEIGWFGDWGMAASAKEKDYVHIAVKRLEERLGVIDYAIVNCAAWERQYYEKDPCEWATARNFGADVVVVRLGENMWSAKDTFNSHPIAPHFAKMIDYFRADKAANVVVTDLFWKKEEIDREIRAVAQKKGYVFVSINDLGDTEENMAIGQFEHAGVAMHPSDLGMQRIAERITAAILQVIDNKK